MKKRGFKKRGLIDESVPEKANRILNGILVVLLLIVARIWQLCVLQHEEKIEEASKPQRRVVFERSERATVCDRFQQPLITNQVQYNASVCYGGIRTLPRSIWKRDERGKKIKYLYRKEYISKLALLLGEELHLNAERIEDMIHSKATLLGNAPCLLKENISEEHYFRLKMLEKDWPGIYAEIVPKREYALGSVGADIVGYMGSMSQREYDAITGELSELRECVRSAEEGEEIPFPEGYFTLEAVRERLEELEKRAYTMSDLVGKAGIEASYDEQLRGLRGKRVYLADTRGNFLRELPGAEEPKAGNKLVLTISSELQAYAESLLIEASQSIPSQKSEAGRRQALMPDYQPWIKAGAVVVMDPKTGAIYALASYPRFDPNDFIRTREREEKINRVHRALESEVYISNIWNLKTPITRERFQPKSGTFFEESLEMTWDVYLRFILPSNSLVKTVLEEKNRLKDALFVQEKMEQLLALFVTDSALAPSKILDSVYAGDGHTPIITLLTLQEREFLQKQCLLKKREIDEIKLALDPYFNKLPLNYEKLLLVDLYRIVFAPSPLFSSRLEKMTLGDYREISGRIVCVAEVLRGIAKDLFYENHFKKWREEFSKEFLLEKRKEEKLAKRKTARPFIDYLDEEEGRQFALFWESNKWDLLSLFLKGRIEHPHQECEEDYKTIGRWYEELKQGAHRGLSWVENYHRLQKNLDPFDSSHTLFLFDSARSFDALERPLMGKYVGLRGSLEKHLAASFYHQYGYGSARSHAFRQATVLGSIFKLVPAYAALVQRYQEMKRMGGNLADLNPLTLIDDKHKTSEKQGGWNVGFTTDGKPISMFYKGGRLPRSDHPHVGKVDVVHALEASSNPYFAILAGEVLRDPEDLSLAAQAFGFGEKTGIELPGEFAGSIPTDIAYNRTGLYSMAIGQHALVGTPLQTAVLLSAIVNGGTLLKPKIVEQEGAYKKQTQVVRHLFLPPEVQTPILNGMKQVIMGDRGTARFLKRDFPIDLLNRVIGKTSTAEVMERVSLDGSFRTLKVTHVAFGGICYESSDFSHPELVVVVYLRFREWGWNAAPYALKLIQKWHEINRAQGK